MGITGFSDTGFPVFGSCDVESADFCTGLEDQPSVCPPSLAGCRCGLCIASSRAPCTPWAPGISCRLCLQGKLAQLWKGHVSSSCHQCGKGFNFWLNCCCFPFHSLGQLLASFRYLCSCPAVKASGTAQCSVQNNIVFNKVVSD